jgi:hypothetical protein
VAADGWLLVMLWQAVSQTAMFLFSYFPVLPILPVNLTKLLSAGTRELISEWLLFHMGNTLCFPVFFPSFPYLQARGS